MSLALHREQLDKALRGRLDQLWGWAKSGKTRDPVGGEYYLMGVENVDGFTEWVLKYVADVVLATAVDLDSDTTAEHVAQALAANYCYPEPSLSGTDPAAWRSEARTALAALRDLAGGER